MILLILPSFMFMSEGAFAKSQKKSSKATRRVIKDNSARSTKGLDPQVSSMPVNDYNPPVSKDRYIGGGVVGTLVGFGIGHGINGTYKKMGWVFTAGELLSLIAIYAGTLDSLVDSVAGQAPKVSNTLVFGIYSLLGFRLWEIFDVWWRPVQMNKAYRESRPRNRVSFGVFPVRGGAQAALGMSF